MTHPNIRGTQTERNLVIAYLAESSAYTRYMYYASAAEKERYYPIANIFAETAANEMRHGKVFFKHLQGGKVAVEVDVDAGVIGTTAENLAAAAREELYEGVELYTGAAITAENEGFAEIAAHFKAIADIEASHRKRFLYYLDQIRDGTLWKRDHEIVWKCLVCGFEYVGAVPPDTCPACDHPFQHYAATDYIQSLEL